MDANSEKTAVNRDPIGTPAALRRSVVKPKFSDFDRLFWLTRQARWHDGLRVLVTSPHSPQLALDGFRLFLALEFSPALPEKC